MRSGGRTTLVTLVVIGAGLVAGMAGGCADKTPLAARDPNSSAMGGSVRDLPEVKALRAQAESAAWRPRKRWTQPGGER
jgi:hypothetical protein